ncbi:MAG: endolytic transglycosylase MltG [Prevotella sp.]|nr:endolytic transglycosylase MltG [Candidatus Prevotella equi]
MKKLFPIGIVVIVAFIFATMIFYALAPVNKTDSIIYLHVDSDDNVDSIADKMSAGCHPYGVWAVRIISRHTGYESHIRTGCYEINNTIGALMLYRHLRNGQQVPVRLTIPSVRTTERLAEELSSKLMMKKDDLMDYFSSNDSCAKYGQDTATIVCLFVPNTYEVYWNISPDKFLSKMMKEKEAFWNSERLAKAEALGLSPDEVVTLASIVEEETANNQEKPMVAGMYYNRLRKPMPLQADPTIKFALQNFELRRIYRNMLTVKSPYNTYVNEGLPPGPIRIPSVVGIDAVLNLVHHDYLYMCAKEDFSGTHNFAVTYSEHLKNAARYSAALNARGIK